MSTTTVVEKKQLRQQLRSLRQQLSPEQQQQAAVNLVRIVSQESVWLHSQHIAVYISNCLLYTSPSPRDRTRSRMPSSA